jgi:hypothetical protein
MINDIIMHVFAVGILWLVALQSTVKCIVQYHNQFNYTVAQSSIVSTATATRQNVDRFLYAFRDTNDSLIPSSRLFNNDAKFSINLLYFASRIIRCLQHCTET